MSPECMHIPCDLLVFKVASFLPPKDQLSISMACRDTYKAFFDANPLFRECYSHKYRCGLVLRRMLDFVHRGPCSVASWTLRSGGRELLVCQMQSGPFCIPGECVEDVFDWFSRNMWGRPVDVSTRCYYKKKERREEFMALTRLLLQALSPGQSRSRR